MDPDRRALTRAYKDTPRTAGVGAVRNTANGKILLVSSLDVRSLLNRHQAQLKLGAHRNAALQEDWQAAGAAAFTFEVLDTLPPPKDPDDDPARRPRHPGSDVAGEAQALRARRLQSGAEADDLTRPLRANAARA